MQKINQKLELVANVLIIVVACLIGYLFVQKYLLKTPESPNEIVGQPARLQPVIGSNVDLPGVDWSQKPKTLVLALKKGCRFCTESASFYKRLTEISQTKNVRLIAVLPTRIEESKGYLGELGLNDLEVRQSALHSLQVGGTPTLILTDGNGTVTDFWIGMLSADKEEEVINKL